LRFAKQSGQAQTRKGVGSAERQVAPRNSNHTQGGNHRAARRRGNVGSHALILDDEDVVLLLKAAVEQEGTISAFARRHGLERSQLNSMLNGKRPVSSPLVNTLGLRKVYHLMFDRRFPQPCLLR
jgi:hypothetical protein